ncbi:MAG: tetratricopeptide repeat protein [Alphaproteobacteria bacterium]|nr:tetratricopeptide repeat protein [Alphaproteobacteria bacterium]
MNTSQSDRTGTPVSCGNPEAVALFDQALNQFHSYFGDPVATIDKALALEPDFALGHLFRGAMFAAMMENKFVSEIESSVNHAAALWHHANDRERGHLRALQRILGGNLNGAGVAWERVLVDYPRDAFALQCGHLIDFYRGDASNLRDRVARVLPHYDAGHPSRSFVLGMQSFGFEECNQFDRAEQIGRQALDLEPRDPWAVHAVAHVMEMQNRYDEGIDWYTERETNWAPDNGFAFHNWWHLGLYHMERGEYERALAIYDRDIYPGEAEFVLGLVDATAFLWRLRLQGVDTGERWRPLADQWQAQAGSENGFYAFNDWHAIMAYVGAGREPAAERLLADMERAAQVPGDNAGMTARVGLPIAKAVWAFGQEDFTTAVEHLLPVRSTANQFGGSNAQRDALNQTLIVAAIRAADHRLVTNLLNERLAHKPESPLAWRFRAVAARAAGDTGTAGDAATKSQSLIATRAPRAA